MSPHVSEHAPQEIGVPKLIIVRGQPPADAFSHATEMALRYEAQLICLSLIRAEQQTDLDELSLLEEAFFVAHDRIHQWLRHGHSVVFNDSYTPSTVSVLWGDVARRCDAELCIEEIQSPKLQLRLPAIRQRRTGHATDHRNVSLSSLWRSTRERWRRGH